MGRANSCGCVDRLRATWTIVLVIVVSATVPQTVLVAGAGLRPMTFPVDTSSNRPVGDSVLSPVSPPERLLYTGFEPSLNTYAASFQRQNASVYGVAFQAPTPTEAVRVECLWNNSRKQVYPATTFNNTANVTAADAVAWVNSATTVEGLAALASQFFPLFEAFLDSVLSEAQQKGVSPAKVAGQKSLERIREKYDRNFLLSPCVNPAEHMSDVIRASFIVDSLADFTTVAAAVTEVATTQGLPYTSENKFNPEYRSPSGYVGLHFGLLLTAASGQTMIAEVQVHFAYIFDGTDECPKEYTHGKFYAPLQRYTLTKQEKSLVNPASKLVYAMGLALVLNGTMPPVPPATCVPDPAVQVRISSLGASQYSYSFVDGLVVRSAPGSGLEVYGLQPGVHTALVAGAMTWIAAPESVVESVETSSFSISAELANSLTGGGTGSTLGSPLARAIVVPYFQDFGTAGNHSWTVPNAVCGVAVELSGGGGGGGAGWQRTAGQHASSGGTTTIALNGVKLCDAEGGTWGSPGVWQDGGNGRNGNGFAQGTVALSGPPIVSATIRPGQGAPGGAGGKYNVPGDQASGSAGSAGGVCKLTIKTNPGDVLTFVVGEGGQPTLTTAAIGHGAAGLHGWVRLTWYQSIAS